MGKVRKLTGQQAAIDAANRQANEQRMALEQSSRAQAQALAAGAAATARSTAQAVSREAAMSRFRDAADVRQEEVDVQLDDQATGGGSRRRRAAFGVGAGSGLRV